MNFSPVILHMPLLYLLSHLSKSQNRKSLLCLKGYLCLRCLRFVILDAQATSSPPSLLSGIVQDDQMLKNDADIWICKLRTIIKFIRYDYYVYVVISISVTCPVVGLWIFRSWQYLN